MQELTIEQLKFARSIGAVYYRLFGPKPDIDYYRDIDTGLNRYSYWGHDSLKWCAELGRPLSWDKGLVLEVDFTPLDDYHADKDADIRTQNAAAIEDGEHYDNVKNPSHYQLLPGVEVIDVRMAILSNMPESVTRAEADHWSRAWEYLTRMWGKNGLEDAKKARVYLDWLIAEMEDDN